MPLPLLALGMMGAGALAGAFSNKSKKSEFSQTTTPTLDPMFQPLQTAAMDQILKRLRQPGAGLQPMKTAAIDGVNKTYSAVPQRLTEQFASRGFNNSGLLGKSMAGAEYSRAGDIAGLEPQFAQMELDQESQAMAQLQQILAMFRGSTTKGTGTQPGNMMGGAFAGAADGFGSGMYLDSILNRR